MKIFTSVIIFDFSFPLTYRWKTKKFNLSAIFYLQKLPELEKRLMSLMTGAENVVKSVIQEFSVDVRIDEDSVLNKYRILSSFFFFFLANGKFLFFALIYFCFFQKRNNR